MIYLDQTINSINRTRLYLFTCSYLTAIGYLIACYFLLTVNNPFNFNNNFHLIGFISFLSFAVQLLLSLTFSRLIHQKALYIIYEEITSDDPFQGLSSFIILLSILFFTILSPLIYFLLINEFMPGQIKPVLLGLSGLFLSILIFGYWISINAFFQKQVTIQWWSVINKIIVFIIFIFIFIIIINFLTGIIPAELKPSSSPYLSL